MGTGKLFWKLFIGNILLMAAVLCTSVWFISHEIQRAHDEELRQTLEVQAKVLREAVADRFDRAHGTELDALIKRMAHGQQRYIRITLVLADGSVLSDSEAEPGSMEPHGSRPEIITALHGETGEDTRLSHTLNRLTKYVALPVGPVDPATRTPIGVIRAAMPVRTIREQAGSMQRLIWGIGGLALAAAVVLAMGLALMWSQPIRRITLAARSFSQGELSTRVRVRVRGNDELATLGRALNEMRARISGQLETIDRQRRTLASMLSELHEGVVVADHAGRIVLVNPAAVRMLGLPRETAEAMTRPPGPPVEACIPRHELQQMLLPSGTALDSEALEDETDAADSIREVRLPAPSGGPEVTVLARASNVLLPAFGHKGSPKDAEPPPPPGRLLVLTDVSELTRLIQIKADFAANASHELRTPLSAIKVALETLAPMDLATETESARRFIDVIARHSQRLESLVADLLELSRLESSRAQFRLAEVWPRDLLAEIHRQRADHLAAKNLEWAVDLPEDLTRFLANPHLLRVALDNIFDNAIKFTEPGGRISTTLRAERRAGGGELVVSISVADTGCGIAAEEQSRVFERFYQVERARSGGVMRGTGLGLSIVRHAVAAMKGNVKLQSELGKGTTVTINIPQPQQAEAHLLDP